LSTYTSSFIAAEEGRQKAQEFIDQKADVIFGAGGFTGSSGIAFAASKKVYVIGVDQDEFRTTFKTGSDANFILSSAVKRVDTGVYTSVKSVLDKNFKGGDLVLGAAQCGVSYAPYHNTDSAVSADVKSKLETIWRALAGGTLLTGVKDGTTAPEPLKAGEMPKVADTAPKFADCTRN
jgi:basic membrane protein A